MPRPLQLRLRRNIRIVIDACGKGADCNERAAAAVRLPCFHCFAARRKRCVAERTAARRTVENGVAAEDVVEGAEVCRRSKYAPRRYAARVKILCMKVFRMDGQLRVPALTRTTCPVARPARKERLRVAVRIDRRPARLYAHAC